MPNKTPRERFEELYNDFAGCQKLWFLVSTLLEEAIQEEREKAQSLEKLIEEIGKDMCHFKFLYPNAGKWTIQDMWDWEHQGETLMEVFQAFKKEREKQKKI